MDKWEGVLKVLTVGVSMDSVLLVGKDAPI